MLRDTLEILTRAFGPSGREKRAAEAVLRVTAGRGLSSRTDPMGNLILEKRGAEEGKVILFSAHLDQVGLVVTRAEKNGFLRVSPVGGLGRDLYTPRHVVFADGTAGVVTSQPVRDREPDTDDLFVDIGAASEQEALERVSPGDMCVYAPELFELGDRRVAGTALDDRCGCALLAELMCSPEPFRNTVIALFSVQEEVGCRGSRAAAYALEPDLGIALDVTAWGDTPGTDLPDIRLGAGPAVKYMDKGVITTPALRDEILRVAEENGIPCQREVLPFGSNDAASIQHARGGIPACTVSIPCRYCHSAAEVIDLNDLEAALRLIRCLADAELG